MNQTPEVFEAMLAALKTARDEAITMVARLPNPYARNQQHVADKCDAAIKLAEGAE